MRPANMPATEYLRECSRTSLAGLEIASLDRAAALRKEMKVLLDEWVRELAIAEMARWLIEHREELARTMSPAEETVNFESGCFLENATIKSMPDGRDGHTHKGS